MRTSDPDGPSGRGAAFHRAHRSRSHHRLMAHVELPPDLSGAAVSAADLSAADLSAAGTVFRNRSFLGLWSAQLLSQLASNMVLAGLMGTVFKATGSNTAIA